VVAKHQHHHLTDRYCDHADAAQDGAVSKDRSGVAITHRFKLNRILEAYETFGRAAKTQALKVIIDI